MLKHTALLAAFLACSVGNAVASFSSRLQIENAPLPKIIQPQPSEVGSYVNTALAKGLLPETIPDPGYVPIEPPVEATSLQDYPSPFTQSERCNRAGLAESYVCDPDAVLTRQQADAVVAHDCTGLHQHTGLLFF
eukprot:GHVU01072662.1.p1 GENE.GHVU01072662.1~~GHVU01072662.1.p1  ORF type:complete len:135 (-),score=12.02 GHVU01072662.1:1540-1944(-)